jgi:glycosyltransferase involved in cell wall biosynthesis
MKISLIIPAYNEEGNINEIYNRTTKIFKDMNCDHEIIFIDDGSIDNTEKYLLQISEADKNVKLISFTRNFGHQSALLAGYNNCRGDIAVTLDCDLQHPPELIQNLVEKWKDGYEVVHTKRIDQNQKSIFKKFTSKYFYGIFSYLSNMPIEEGSADFRLIDKKVVEKINNLKENDIFLRGMFHWFGFKSTYLEYLPSERFSGTTKYNISKMIKFALIGITSFSTVPLRMATIIGFCISSLSFVYMIYVLYSAIFAKDVITGWTSLLLSVLFLGGMQLIAVGILGEYIGKIFIEMKERPRYIVKSKAGF